MKSIILKMLLASAMSMAGPAGGSAQPGPSGAEEPFKLVKVRGGVSLYERWVTVQSGQKVRELKAEFTVEAGLSAVVNLLKDPLRASSWMQSLDQFDVLETHGAGRWTSYVRYRIPWPLNDQDVVLRYERSDVGKQTTIAFRSVSRASHPEQEGVSRMEGVSGAWVLTPKHAAQTQVVYTILTQNRSRFPRWMTDPIVQDNLLDTMNAFCVQARELHAQR